MDGAFWFQEGSQRGGAKKQHPIVWLQKDQFQRLQMFCWCGWLVKMEYGIFHNVPEPQGGADHATNPNVSRVFTNHWAMLR